MSDAFSGIEVGQNQFRWVSHNRSYPERKNTFQSDVYVERQVAAQLKNQDVSRNVWQHWSRRPSPTLIDIDRGSPTPRQCCGPDQPRRRLIR